MKRILKRALIVGMLFVTSPALAWEFKPMQPGQAWQAPNYQPVQPPVNKYNPMNNSWGYEKADSVNVYNPMNNSWSYEDRDSSLQYNPMSQEWEYK